MLDIETILQGLYVTAMGMFIVFAALTLVMLAIMALDRVFRPRAAALEDVSPKASLPLEVEIPSSSSGSGGSAPIEPGIVAAVATALALRLQETEEAVAPMPVRVISLKDEASLWAAVGKLG